MFISHYHFLIIKRRLKIITSIKFVDNVEKTGDWDYRQALEKIRPDFVVHGDDWKENNQKQVRANVIKQIKTWKGSLIELHYTKKEFLHNYKKNF